jgi:hypothetical protein
VLAVAAPRRLIDHTAQWAAAAGIRIERIALRTTGCAALLKSIDDRRPTIGDSILPAPAALVEVEDVGGDDAGAKPTAGMDTIRARAQASIANRQSSSPPALLGIDVVGEGVEFCVVADGSIRFSRAAEVPAPQDQLAMADAVVTEARRTWMSYRAAEDGSEAARAESGASGAIDCALIMGDRRVAEYAAEPLAQMLKIPVRVLRQHACIDVAGDSHPDGPAVEIDRVWPLAGLLLERELGVERIDFLKPRRAPDLAARTRQRRLLAAAALLVVGGGLWTAMRFDLRNLRDEVEGLALQRGANLDAYDRVNRDRYKLTHLKEWDSVQVDWLEHARFLAEVAPPPDKVVLDSWSGTLDFRGVTCDTRAQPPRWAADHQTTIIIEGEARDRATADGFRELLTQNTIYTTSTTGADTRGGKRMPFGFTYRLRTRAPAPAGEPAGQPQAAVLPSASAGGEGVKTPADAGASTSGASAHAAGGAGAPEPAHASAPTEQ